MKIIWESFLVANNAWRVPLNLYLHIPWCEGKCNYCRYETYPYKNSKELERYLEYLSKEINYYKKTFSRIVFGNLYIGGGTPSLLSAEQIRLLCGLIFTSFNFNKSGFKTFECSPNSASEEKMRAVKESGINRVSLGVQSLTKKVIRSACRPQTNETAFKALDAILRQNFDHVNVDLLIGLRGETPDSFRRSVLEIAKFGAHDINCYFLQPQQLYLKNRQELYYREQGMLFVAALKDMRLEMKKYGYFFTEDSCSIVFSLRNPRSQKNKAQDNTRPPDYEQVSEQSRSNLGLGTLSISHIHQVGDFKAIGSNGTFNPNAGAYFPYTY